MDSFLLGIDLGTSSLKAVVADADGALRAVESREYPIHQLQPGWAEQDVGDWERAMFAAVRGVLERSGVVPGQIAAIGLSGQMHGTVCIDGWDEALRPAIIWADRRSAAEVEEIEKRLGRGFLARETGNPLATGFMLPTWLWLREHEPETARRTAHLLLPKDYLRLRLTGEVGSEPSDASATGLFNPTQGDWSQPLMDALEIQSALLPPIFPSGSAAGRLVEHAARETGLLPGTPVVFGGGDQACQALGNGIIQPGNLSCTIGTGGQLLAPTVTPMPDPELRLHLYNHVEPGLFFSMGAILSAGLSLRWLRDNVLAGLDYQELADLAATAPPGCEGLIFLPHLAGERTPHMDPNARGAFVGLTLRHTRAHLARAVMEGVVFALRQALDLMLDLGIPAERLVASGGGTAHPLWLQLQADIFDRPVYRTRTVEAAAVGAAMLAGIGADVFADAADAVRRVVRWHDEIIPPQPANVARYQQIYNIFTELYLALHPRKTKAA
ncbi:MAG: xylulokinase [Caldilineales bacterium]|nr:xylulokinase [Caldilineales bacterium]